MATIKLPKLSGDVYLRGDGERIYFFDGPYRGAIEISGCSFFTSTEGKEFPKFIKALEMLPKKYRQQYVNEHIVYINDDGGYNADSLYNIGFKVLNPDTIKKASIVSAKKLEAELKPVFGGVYVDAQGYAATNSRQLVYIQETTDLVYSCIIPASIVGLIDKTTKNIFVSDENSITIVNGKVLFQTPAVDGQFPDYERVIPKNDLNYSIVYGPGAVENLSLLISMAKGCNAKLKIEDGTMSANGSSISINDVRTNLPHCVNGNFLKTAFDMGITSFLTPGPMQPIVGRINNATYVFMPISSSEE